MKKKKAIKSGKKKKSSYKHLVNEYVENISADLFDSKYMKIIRGFIKKKQGIYALYKGKELYYVGLASWMSLRLKQHLNDRHAGKWDRFSIYLTEDIKFLKEMETLVLRIANPRGNKLPGKFVGAVNMKSEIRKAYNAEKKKEEESLFGRKKRTLKTIPIKKTKRKTKSSQFKDIIPAPCTIKMKYKNKEYIAKVLKDGTIKYKNKIYKSPSMAAMEIRGLKSNGWRWWKYKNKKGEWVYIDELRKGKKSFGTNKKSGKFKGDMIIVPAKKDGFERTFIGKNCWYAIKINQKYWNSIKYIAAYQSHPVSAITHWAKVDKITLYKKTGKCIVYFKNKASKLKHPIPLDDKHYTPFSRRFTTYEKFRKAKRISDLFKLKLTFNSKNTNK